jgi:hypothetical protein
MENPLARAEVASTQKPTKNMLYTIAIVLLILWLLGLVTSYTLGGVLHILLVVAIVLFILGMVRGRPVG